MRALSLHITGIVQGVGFRPFVYNLARQRGLVGWVLNSSEGVFCLVQGAPEDVDTFPDAIRESAPPMARIESIVAEEVEPESLADFTIRESAAVAGAMTLVSPDIATCPACVTELGDPADRRYRFPFINCTNCGPRFTIIDDVPYDRPSTAMAAFEMCPECRTEYADPADRRFHAQPDACFICGPRLYLNPGMAEELPATAPHDACWSPECEPEPRPHRNRDTERKRADAILAASCELLRTGHVLAIKGLGGFHLACDATDESAVTRLRSRKHRWGKPLAVMVPDIDSARRLVDLTPEAESLLTGTVRPIVLAPRCETAGAASADGAPALAPSVAESLPELGIMLPYTPLHHLLLAEVDRPLVMTSGNVSDEPISTDNAEALGRLAPIADAFLLHDRPIRSRYDDSVTRALPAGEFPMRRARGYAPHPVALSFESDVHILAVGPEQKNTFTLVRDGYAFVSQHIGDMENALTLEHFESTLDLYSRLFRVSPAIVAHDLHPEYLSTKFALTLDLPKVGVQHHHAHIAGVAAEHGVSDPVIGIALDGTGYGSDGHIWGGEVLVSDWERFDRIAHLREVPLPGGAAAIRRPARMAVGTLLGLDASLMDHPGAAPLLSRLAPGEEAILRRMVERGVNTPPTSSMGRLFDAIAALVGVRDDALYEGQAAIELEAACDPAENGAYAFDIVDGTPAIIDHAGLVESVLDDIAAGVPVPLIAARFHRAVSDCIVSLSKTFSTRVGTRYVALAGGVFLNRVVLESSWRGLEAAGLTPLAHQTLPVSDGSVSFGQAVVAWARRHEY